MSDSTTEEILLPRKQTNGEEHQITNGNNHSNTVKKKNKKKKKEGRPRKPKSEPIESHWADLPDLILERIFSYLTIRQRFTASIVCQRWNDAFYLPYVWSNFVMTDETLIRRKFNYYMGWQLVLDHMRTQNCLATIGRNIQTLIFDPMYSFHNMYEFVVMLSYYLERNQKEKTGKVIFHKGNIIPVSVQVRGGGMGIGSRISTLRFTFPCDMSETSREEDERIIGTGGKLLESLKRLMGSLGKSLRHLQLIDLLLERFEALKLLDDVCFSCCSTLQSLTLINVTKTPCQMLHAGVFVNLQVLVVSPQSLGADLLVLLGDCPHLQHLHILQNRYTPENIVSSLPWKTWRMCRWANPALNVHLQLENVRSGEVIWQTGAPVRSILYKSPHLKVTSSSVLTAIDQYRSDLQVYGHLGLPRFARSKSFHERVDPLLLQMCKQCPNLHTLVVRERISTATVLLLAYTGQNLRFLHVRRNAVMLRRDWPRSAEWSDTFYEWLSAACRSYEATEREVSQLLGHPWTMLTDRQFKLTSVDLQRTQFVGATVRASFHTYVPPPPLPIAERADNSVPMQKRRQKKTKKVINGAAERSV